MRYMYRNVFEIFRVDTSFLNIPLNAISMLRSLLKAATLLAVPVVADLFPDCVNGPLSNNTVCDSSASVADRVKALVNALDVDEKMNLTGSNSPGVPRLGIPSCW
jgi:hypothetical protein